MEIFPSIQSVYADFISVENFVNKFGKVFRMLDQEKKMNLTSHRNTFSISQLMCSSWEELLSRSCGFNHSIILNTILNNSSINLISQVLVHFWSLFQDYAKNYTEGDELTVLLS